MRRVVYSPLAEDDLVDIAHYTVRKWGIEQADLYVAEIEDACTTLARYPSLGRKADALQAELRRFEHRSHVVFFRVKHEEVVILRILHKSRAPELHEF